MHEVLPQNGPGIKFGVAFCEVSGAMLGRWSGTDGAMVELAKRTALALSAGHSVINLGAGYFPVSMLNAIKMAREVCRIFRASANPVEVVIAETAQGRGIHRVIDGGTSKVSKTRRHDWRKDLPCKHGDKL